MTPLEKKIINAMQHGIPLVERPFEEIGKALGLTEDEVIERVSDLKARGYIRRFGGIADINALGVVSTLVGLSVEDDKLAQVAQTINGYEGVTHNYERRDAFNLWYTLMAPSQEELGRINDTIAQCDGVLEAVRAPAVCKFKTKVILNL